MSYKKGGDTNKSTNLQDACETHTTDEIVSYTKDNIISGEVICACASRPNEILLSSRCDSFTNKEYYVKYSCDGSL